MKSKENRESGKDVGNFSRKDGSSFEEDGSSLIKNIGGLELIVDVTSAIKKYEKEAAPSGDSFLFWP